MSSFIVQDRTINRVLAVLHDHRVRTYYSEYDLTEQQEIALGRKLMALNVEATTQRYNGRLHKKETEATNNYEHEALFNVSLIQGLKSAEYLLYQCSEGNVPKKKLYKWLETLIQRLRSIIISELKEHNSAEWG